MWRTGRKRHEEAPVWFLTAESLTWISNIMWNMFFLVLMLLHSRPRETTCSSPAGKVQFLVFKSCQSTCRDTVASHNNNNQTSCCLCHVVFKRKNERATVASGSFWFVFGRVTQLVCVYYVGTHTHKHQHRVCVCVCIFTTRGGMHIPRTTERLSAAHLIKMSQMWNMLSLQGAHGLSGEWRALRIQYMRNSF